MRKAIKYNRFSSDGQSLHSIERQDTINDTWIKFNDVHLVDTFSDDGYTARNFDRPDVKKLFAFIKANASMIDYLVVSELTRFSRKAGDAINMVEKIQEEYGIKIVSASRGMIYDCNDSNSFFMMGLEFLLGNSENIKRTNDINGGVYTAKAIKGKYIGAHAPYGYYKHRTGETYRLLISESQAQAIRYIYEAYLSNTPEYIIKQKAKELGFTRTGNDAIRQILTNSVYMGYQEVKAYKDLPGGLFALKDHENIIDPATWYRVQEKLSERTYRKSLTDDLPLRGLLKCYCNIPLTGAYSTGKSGKKYPFYKCNQRKHNNISATKAHDQLQQILQLLSLPHYLIEAIRDESSNLLNEKIKQNQSQLMSSRQKLLHVEEQLHSVEEKWITNKMPADTFHRWHTDLTSQKIKLSGDITVYSRNEKEKWFILDQQLEKLSDLQYLYNNVSTTDKQELLRQVFDNGLYYKEKIYRTPYLMETFMHNALILKQKELLIIDGWEYYIGSNPARWSLPGSNRTLHSLLDFLSVTKVA